MKNKTLLTLLFLGLNLFSLWGDEARISYLRGQTDVIRKGQALIGESGMTLLPGDKIRVAGDSQVTVDLGGDKFIRVNSRAGFEIPANQKPGLIESVNLHFGKIWASVKKLAAGESFSVKTPTASAGVRGTDFQMSFDEINKITQTCVHHGSVMVKNSLGDIQKLTDGMVANITENIMKTVQDQLEITRRFVEEAARIPLDESEKALQESQKMVSELNKQIDEMVKKQLEETQKFIDKTMQDTQKMIDQQMQETQKNLQMNMNETNKLLQVQFKQTNDLTSEILKDVNSDLGKTLNESLKGIENFNFDSYDDDDDD